MIAISLAIKHSIMKCLTYFANNMYIYQFTDNTNYESIYAWFSQLTQIQKNSIIGMLRIDFLPILVQRNGGAASHLR